MTYPSSQAKFFNLFFGIGICILQAIDKQYYLYPFHDSPSLHGCSSFGALSCFFTFNF